MTREVPRQIWMLWSQGLDQLPPVPRECVESWRRLNPGWEVRPLSADNLCEWADPVLAQPKARSLPLAEAEQPGPTEPPRPPRRVWADATCYCMKPLDEWLPHVLGSGFFAFERPGHERLISNWFLASRPGGHIAQTMWSALSSYYLDHDLSNDGWRGQLQRGLGRGMNLHARTTSLWFVSPLPQLGITPHYSFHYMFNRLTRCDPEFATIWDRTPKLSADGPHRLQSHGLGRPPSPQIVAEIEQRRVPVYKLTWRIDPARLAASSTLNVLIDRGADVHVAQSPSG